MQEHNYDDWRAAGALSYKAINFAKGLAKPGAKLIDIAKAVEEFVKENGQTSAFPINLSINEAAAHYTPGFNDAIALDEKSLLKIDYGTKKGTGAGDCAVSVDLTGEYGKLVEASEQALQNALSLVKAGRKVREIGKEIERTIKSFSEDFNPIRNLGGHGITETDLHADIFIPNFDNGDETELEEGQIAAIEPFVTTGEGYVVDGDIVEIFSFMPNGSLPRSQEARDLASYIYSNFSTYPFAMRWIVEHVGSEFKAKKAINELLAAGMLEPFPVLVERSKGVVAQTEAAFIVEKDSCEVITK